MERVREACEAYRRFKALRRESRVQQQRQMQHLQQLLVFLREHELHVVSLREVK